MMLENIDAFFCLAFQVVVNSDEKWPGSSENITKISITLKKIIGYPAPRQRKFIQLASSEVTFQVYLWLGS